MNNEYPLISKSRLLLSMKDTNFSLNEYKLLELYLSRINPLDPTTARVVITVSEFCNVMGIKSGKVRESQLKNYTTNLLKNVVLFPRNEAGSAPIKGTLFSEAEYNAYENILVLVCSHAPEVYSMFFYTENTEYIQYPLKNILSFSSLYSYRLYMLLKSNASLKIFTISIIALRNQLGVTPIRYEVFKYFSQEILKKAIKEINTHTDMNVEYKRLTRNRIIYALQFTIKKSSAVREPDCEKVIAHEKPTTQPFEYGSLTKNEFDYEIEKGISDIKAGRAYSADAIEAEMKKDFGM